MIMASLRTLFAKLTGLFRKARLEQQLHEDIQAHLDMLAEENLRKGMTPEEARYAAQREFGNIASMKEECRESWSIRIIEELVQDVRYGLRQLRRNPGFTIVAVLTLALGIGANTAIFSVIDAVMHRRLPVKDPGQLRLLSWTCAANRLPLTSNASYKFHDSTSGTVCSSLSYPFFQQLQAHTEVFASVFGFAPLSLQPTLNIDIDGRIRVVEGELVTGNYFSGLGAQPILGRPITDQDEKTGVSTVAVISYRFWRAAFGGSPEAIGKAFKVNGMPFTVVGVAQPDFFGLDSESMTDIWIPVGQSSGLTPWGLQPTSGHPLFMSEDRWWLIVVARLKPGITQQRASAVLNGLFRQSLTATLNPTPKPEDLPHLVLLSASRGLGALRQQLSPPLLMLLVTMCLGLAIACTNVAILLSARGTTRQREIGVRLALGASRARLICQLLTECVILAGIGAAFGLLFAAGSVRLLILMLTQSGERVPHNVYPDLTVLAFTIAVSLLTAILFGLAPSLHATRLELTPLLKEGVDQDLASNARLGLRLGNTLVVAQVAISLFLVVVAGLFVTTLRNLRNQDIGFNTRNLLLFSVDPGAPRYGQANLARLYARLQQRICAVPGVRSSALSLLTLGSGAVNTDEISIHGYRMGGGQNPEIFWNGVGPDFFGTMSMPLLLGRGMDPHDMEKSSKVAVVNGRMARYFFGNANPLGRHISFRAIPKEEFEIVGVVKSAKDSDLHEEPPRTVYIPYTQIPTPLGRVYFEVRTNVNPVELIDSIQHVVHEVDSHLAILDLKTETQQLDESLLQERFFSALSASFGAFALLLASMGIYGTVAYSVNRRTHEIGIRLALGAQRNDILRMIARNTIILLLIGLAIGMPCTLVSAKLVSSMLFGVKPSDPLTFIAVSLILIVVALLACYIPARRAAKVDPMVALRYE
ncbi:MAG: ABC transporter permease [Acidobacteria bacterium]|nr:MAG: ABC transporter permease [Acidobacteriota bacterium]